MKVQNIKDVNKFFEVIDSCKGKVELVTGEGAGGLQGHRPEDAWQDQLRHHPQRAGGPDGDGLSGTAPHLRRTGPLRQGLPAVCQRADGAPVPEPGGGGKAQHLPGREAGGNGPGHGPGGPDGLVLCVLSRLRRGGPQNRRHRAAL